MSHRVLALLRFLLVGLGATAGCSGSGGAVPAEGGAGDAGRDAGSRKPDARTTEEGGPTDAQMSLPPTLITEPDQGMTPIYNLIQSAKSSIDMTMYELVDTQASDLLCTAAENGIAVRVILDQNLEMSNNQAAYTQLKGCGVSVVWAWTKYAATHQNYKPKIPFFSPLPSNPKSRGSRRR